MISTCFAGVDSEGVVEFSQTLLRLKITFSWGFFFFINLGYHVNPKYSNPLLFTLYFFSTSPVLLPHTINVRKIAL